MDEPRAQSDNAVSVALANLTALIEDTDERALERVKALDRLVDARFNAAETALGAAKDALDSKMGAGDQELLSHIQAQRVSVDAALVSLKDVDVEREKSLQEFKHSMHNRFAQVNAFREALDDLGKTMATRREVEDFKQTYTERHEAVNKAIVALGSRIDVGNPALLSLQQQVAADAARSGGLSDGAKMLAAVLAAVLVMLGIYAAIKTSQNQNVRQTPPTVTVTTPASR